jgi:MFS family permease
MGGFVVTPILLDDVYGWTVGSTALILAPRPGAFSISSPIGGYMASRWGERRPIILGALAMVISMMAFTGASGGGSLGLTLIVTGLVLSGVSAGISQPGVASMVAGAVDQRDLGIANGMSQQMMFIGIVSGIQVMLVLLGDAPGTSDFARTFVVGGIVAAMGLAAATATRDRG